LFLSTTPPPPTSTLFPYTTLFRSLEPLDDRAARPAACAERLPEQRPEPVLHDPGPRPGLQEQVRLRRRAGRPALQVRVAARARRDRKSTRLNSSHSQISYAVFCLK